MAKNKEQLAFDAFKADSVGILNLKRIENSITSGQPDVIAINRQGVAFWMENKALHEWPKRDTTVVLKGKFEKGQLSYLREWVSWRGKGYVLLRVGKEYYLLDPKRRLDELCKTELVATAIAVGKKNIIEYLGNLEN